MKFYFSLLLHQSLGSRRLKRVNVQSYTPSNKVLAKIIAALAFSDAKAANEM